MTTRFANLVLATIAGASVLAGCGGGTEGTGGVPPPSQGITSTGTMTRGSVILNGVRFDDSTALVTDDRNRGAAQLADGMVVRLRGRSDDGVSGSADRIDVENEARGAIQSILPNADPQRFVVAGLTVVVDGQTIYANAAGFAALQVGTRVEVHGLRDGNNLLRATRVEVVGATDGADELRGPIANVDTGANTFTINGAVSVDYSSALFNPAGTGESDLTSGAVVEVRGSLAGNVFTATQIDIEAREDAIFAGNPGEKQEVEGFVTGFASGASTFQVAGRTLRLTPGTRFEGGSAADLANDVRVEVEGTIDASGVLVAVKVEFKQVRLILHGLATTVNPTLRIVVALNQTVRVTDLTRIETRGGNGDPGNLANIQPGVDCVEIRGFAAGPIFIADEIKEASGCGKDLVQAPVTAKNATSFELRFFGNLVARLDGAGVSFRDVNDAPISRDAFFAAVTAAQSGVPGTLVKVQGVLTGNVVVGEEAELQD